MSTARPCLKSTQSLSGTSAHPTMVTQVNITVMNGWLTSFLFHVNPPSHSWDKAISDFDLEISTPGSRSWVRSKGKVIQSAQYHINSLHFHFTSIRPEIELFPVPVRWHLYIESGSRSSAGMTMTMQDIGRMLSSLRLNFNNHHCLNVKEWHKSPNPCSYFLKRFSISKYSWHDSSIPWLLMPWFLGSPGHQLQCFWPCKISRSLSRMMKNLNTISVFWNDWKY